MEQREFAKHLRCNMTESENKLWLHLRAHRLNGEIMSNLEGVLATVLTAETESPLSPAPLPQGERGENRYPPTTLECTRLIPFLNP